MAPFDLSTPAATPKKSIAIIGGGISGLSAAFALQHTHQVTLFEKDDRIGGHANTKTISKNGKAIAVDTGFIVYNPLNYPNFIALLDHLKVATQNSDMSFGISNGAAGGEWCSNGFSGIFAYKRNIFSVNHWQMLVDILRFNAAAKRDLNPKKAKFDLGSLTLGQYCAALKVSGRFLSHYVMPMGAAIWSTPTAQMADYPALAFVRFFNNHRLLGIKQPIWRTITGGSGQYVKALTAALSKATIRHEGVANVSRQYGGVMVVLNNGEKASFDAAIFACHCDTTTALLADKTQEESAILSAIAYGPNVAVLHTDASYMPNRTDAWASWNVRTEEGSYGRLTLTYWMNRLQNLDENIPLFVTLNPKTMPAAAHILSVDEYDHPLFNAAAIKAQAEISLIQGRGGVYYAGAWTGYGFHEDGVRSGLRVAMMLGGSVPWNFVEDDIQRATPQPTQNAAPIKTGRKQAK